MKLHFSLKKKKKEVNEVIQKNKITEYLQKKSNQKQAHFNATSKKLKAFYSIKLKNKKQSAKSITKISSFGKSQPQIKSSKNNQQKPLLTNSQTVSNLYQTNPNPSFSQDKKSKQKKMQTKNEYPQAKKNQNRPQKIRKKVKNKKKGVKRKKKKTRIW